MSVLLKHRPMALSMRTPIRAILTRPSIRPISSTQSLFPASLDPAPHNERVITILERTVLSPERAETTCSGTDNAVGHNSHSYDPSITSPETEFATFEEEVTLGDKMGETDPLFISPANRDFSRLLDREIDGRAVVADKGDRLGNREGSVRGWVKKGRLVKVVSGGYGGVTRDEFERLLKGLRRLQMREAAQKKGETTATA
ncbi:hypothetical protein BDV06DRAFT_220603 [Aspergillus oleicola]